MAEHHDQAGPAVMAAKPGRAVAEVMPSRSRSEVGGSDSSSRKVSRFTEDLARVYPEQTVVAQLKQLHRNEINRAIEEVNGLLPRYRGRVDATTYARESAKLLLVAAYLHDDSMSVHALEKSLKYVLKQQRVFNGASS